MVKSVFIIVFMGGSYEDKWTQNMKWCFKSYERAEEHLLKGHYKKCIGYLSDGYYEPVMEKDYYDDHSASLALS